MFSTLNNIFWILINLISILLWIVKLSWKLLIIICFIYGLLNLVFLMHRLCKYIARKHQEEAKVANHSQSQNVIILDQTFESYNSFGESNSEFSSRRSSQDFVVTSWDNFQVTLSDWVSDKKFKYYDGYFQESEEEEEGYIAAYKM